MKKLLSLCLALLLTAGCLAGCSPETPQDSTPGASGSGASTAPSTEASTAPITQPTAPPTVPTTQPTVPPTAPTTQPTQPSTAPTTQPTQPSTAPSTQPTTQPTQPPVTEPPAPALGSDENPAQLIMGGNSAVLTGQGSYWFSWVAPEDATLLLEIDGDAGWAYQIHNMTAGEEFLQTGTSADELLANPALVPVFKGDLISIAVNTLSGEAGTVTLTASLTEPMGTEDNPLRVHVGGTTYLRVPAGQTLYFSERAQGTTLVVTNAATATLEFQGQTYLPEGDRIQAAMPPLEGGRAEMLTAAITNTSGSTQIYAVSFQIPMGTVDNPAPLELGSNTATVEANDPDGYIFLWTAPADGTLTLTMPGDSDWCYSLYNLTSFAASAQFYSNDDPVTGSYSMAVKAGDVVQISVSTFNPKRPNKIPAGDVIFTAEFAEN